MQHGELNANKPIAGTINTIDRGAPAGGPAGERLLPKRPRTSEVISFSNEDLKGVETPHDDAVVISMVVNKFDVKCVLLDNGSSANILYFDAYSRMGMTEKQLRRMNTPLVGFTGDSVPVEDEVDLLVMVGLAPRESTVGMGFFMVRLPSAYNAILGRPGLNALQVVVSTCHVLMRFPTSQGVGEVRGDQTVARRCYMATHEAKQPAKVSTSTPDDKL
ncbi:uncharacterized protein LOC120110758 [Phoenix dactylifera]|uniref:Uncharacterized protein LOC120110758 n=1 Tax=Phoenix dactylifera TaxID=42345 RepID=A0A8B9A6G5_PHODC|nr:uncharacterized protein LOC120110758 [Phoenix dactylifera]